MPDPGILELTEPALSAKGPWYPSTGARVRSRSLGDVAHRALCAQMYRLMTMIVLLIVSNIFMTFAWYRHLKAQADSPLWLAIVTSWGIAFFEYCLAVPANRFGFGKFSLVQLKTLQEVITLSVFAVFAALYMRERLTVNHLFAAFCLIGAVFFAFR